MCRRNVFGQCADFGLLHRTSRNSTHTPHYRRAGGAWYGIADFRLSSSVFVLLVASIIDPCAVLLYDMLDACLAGCARCRYVHEGTSRQYARDGPVGARCVTKIEEMNILTERRHWYDGDIECSLHRLPCDCA